MRRPRLVSIEDPIEVAVDGVAQSQVNDQVGLLLLTVVVAISAAGVGTSAKTFSLENPEPLVACVILGILLGALVGAVVGIRQGHSVGGIVVGAFFGMGAGPACMVFLAVHNNFFVIAIGSAVMLVFVAAVRVFSR